jgi:hypothetical protein
LYGVFVWARRALKHRKRRFPARAGEKGPPSFHNAVRDDGAFGAGLTDLLGFECAPHAHYGDKPSSRLEPQGAVLGAQEILTTVNSY